MIGAGFMGAKHARIISEMQGAQLVGVADIDERRARDVSTTCQVRAYFQNYMELLSQPDLDAVIVATPEHLHRDPVVASLKAGKDVFVEKPIATTIPDADAMIDAAANAGKKLMVGYNFHFDPNFTSLADYVSEGGIGKPISAFGRINAPIQAGRYWGKQIALELSFSIHLVDLILWYFTDTPVDVSCERVNGKLHEELGVADFSWISFRMSRGGLGVVECGWALSEKWGGQNPDGTYSTPRTWFRAPDVSFEIIGTEGSAYLDYHPQSIRACDREGWKFPETTLWPIINGRIGGALREEDEHFLDCVRRNKEPAVDGKFARVSLEVVLASIEAAEKKEHVMLPIK